MRVLLIVAALLLLGWLIWAVVARGLWPYAGTAPGAEIPAATAPAAD